MTDMSDRIDRLEVSLRDAELQAAGIKELVSDIRELVEALAER